MDELQREIRRARAKSSRGSEWGSASGGKVLQDEFFSVFFMIFFHVFGVVVLLCCYGTSLVVFKQVFLCVLDDDLYL